MFSGLLQPTHLILILVVVLIVFGPGKLPEAGQAMGKAMRDMRDAFSSSEEGANQEENQDRVAKNQDAAAQDHISHKG